MKIQVVILLAIVTIVAAKDSAQIYCGRQLSRTLAGLCYEKYYNQEKRSQTNGFYDFEHSSEYISPWLADSMAQRLNGGRGKKSVGIVSECCDKPCTIDEMMTYC
ncbi:insulin-related peptide 2-like [Leguminivora glycinivorella]|uniref:insulin-related peptide 2-like n=1 Tax=Leguminivora glycinivorella TaxID=1035111 RepID=UPI00200E2295|nr:insulin-related peptide 2-like [Leguminivora glycinivorella]